MKKKLFVVVVLAAFMLLASLSTSTAGILREFDTETAWNRQFTLLTTGTRQDYPSSKSSVRVNTFVGYDSTDPNYGSIDFECKIEAKIGGQWIKVHATDERIRCIAGYEHELDRLTVVPLDMTKYIPNGTQMRAMGRNWLTYWGGEPMRGRVNFN
ncbi:MAG: hypothetical protein IKI64_10155 [Clostridia bacterium]|nr:hypothetical protein [Clostridia bacterium]